jgi:penicillin-binding protein 1C
MLLDILSDPVARVPGFGVDTPFEFPFAAAVKTGTSHHFTDNWAVGVTGGFTVAVWAGNFSGRPMKQVSGVTGAGPLLHHAMVDVAKYYEPGDLPSPASFGAHRVTICRISGLLAAHDCPGVDEWVYAGAEPAGHCTWHRRGVVALPAEYAEWAAQNPGMGNGESGIGNRGALGAASADFRIVSPLDGDRYQIPPGVDPRYATIPLRAVGAPADEPVRWWIDGRRAPSTQWQLERGAHAIRAVGASGRAHEVSISVR